jgi:hypothetical protein
MPETYRPARRIIINVIGVGVNRSQPGGENRAGHRDHSLVEKVAEL